MVSVLASRTEDCGFEPWSNTSSVVLQVWLACSPPEQKIVGSSPNKAIIWLFQIISYLLTRKKRRKKRKKEKIFFFFSFFFCMILLIIIRIISYLLTKKEKKWKEKGKTGIFFLLFLHDSAINIHVFMLGN